MYTTSLLQIAVEAANKAGNILLDGFTKVKEVHFKSGVHNIVTQFDFLSEKTIISTISEAFPLHSFLAEESGLTKGDTNTVRWIIDPLDGTVNFAHGIPIFSVSIAAEYKSEIVCGVIYHPLMNELFVAEKGKGAFLNGQKINVSSTNNLKSSILVTGFPYNVHQNPEHAIQHFTGLVDKGIPIRRLGSAAIDMAYVACGRFDGFWEVGLSPWDVAAGWLIIKEAGGTVSDFSGNDYNLSSNTILSTNSNIHQEFVQYLGSTT